MRHLVVFPLDRHRLFACEDRAQYVDVFASALERTGVRLAVPALDHLGSGGTDTEVEAAARKVIERHGRHGRGSRGTGGHLGNCRAELDACCLRAPPRERREGVRTVSFRGPDRVEAEALCFGDGFLDTGGRPGTPVACGQPCSHSYLLLMPRLRVAASPLAMRRA